jgi:hypothetical protein
MIVLVGNFWDGKIRYEIYRNRWSDLVLQYSN